MNAFTSENAFPLPNKQPVGLERAKRKVGRPKKIPSSGNSIPSEREYSISDYSFPPHGDSQTQSNDAERVGNGEEKGRGKRAHPTQSQSKLAPEVKHRIVELLACFHTHSSVKAIIKEEFNLTLSNSVLSVYDPQRVACGMSSRLRAFYDEVRKRYVEQAKDVAISHQAHRLRKLEAISDQALAAKDFGNAIKALEIAAKEMGGLLEAGSTKVEVKHSGTIGHVHASVDEARAEVAMRLSAIAERAGFLSPPREAQRIEDEDGDIVDV